MHYTPSWSSRGTRTTNYISVFDSWPQSWTSLWPWSMYSAFLQTLVALSFYLARQMYITYSGITASAHMVLLPVFFTVFMNMYVYKHEQSAPTLGQVPFLWRHSAFLLLRPLKYSSLASACKLPITCVCSCHRSLCVVNAGGALPTPPLPLHLAALANLSSAVAYRR